MASNTGNKIMECTILYICWYNCKLVWNIEVLYYHLLWEVCIMGSAYSVPLYIIQSKDTQMLFSII